MEALGVETIGRTGGWLALAFVAGLLIALIGKGSLDGADIFAIPAAVIWIGAPIVGAAAFVGASTTRLGALVFLASEILLAASTIWLMVDLKLNGNSTGVLAFIPWPVVQWVALGLVFLIALPCGWRMRSDFLKG